MSISKRARIQFTSVDRHEVFNVDQSSVGHSSLRTAPKAADIQSDDSFARTQSIILCVWGVGCIGCRKELIHFSQEEGVI